MWVLVGWLVGWCFGFVGFFCSWCDRAAKTLCFLTLACRRSVITGDSTLALSLPAWILRAWERLLVFRALLSGEEYFTLLSQCPENCLYSSNRSLCPSLTPKSVSDVSVQFQGQTQRGGWAPCLFLSTHIPAGSLQSAFLTVMRE